jgi:hypothetical protein
VDACSLSSASAVSGRSSSAASASRLESRLAWIQNLVCSVGSAARSCCWLTGLAPSAIPGCCPRAIKPRTGSADVVVRTSRGFIKRRKNNNSGEAATTRRPAESNGSNTPVQGGVVQPDNHHKPSCRPAWKLTSAVATERLRLRTASPPGIGMVQSCSQRARTLCGRPRSSRPNSNTSPVSKRI